MLLRESAHWAFVLKVFIFLLWVRISAEGFSRIFTSFPGVSLNMLIHQNEHIEEFGDHSLLSFTALVLSWVCLALIVFLLFVPLTSSVLEFSWYK